MHHTATSHPTTCHRTQPHTSAFFVYQESPRSPSAACSIQCTVSSLPDGCFPDETTELPANRAAATNTIKAALSIQTQTQNLLYSTWILHQMSSPHHR
jgi:hypothetical protein